MRKTGLLAVCKRMGAVIETSAIFPNMTAQDNLKVQCHLIAVTTAGLTVFENGVHGTANIPQLGFFGGILPDNACFHGAA